MARRSRHRGAFMMGLLLGGAAAAAAAIWNSPQSGKRTRELITEKVEAGLFTLLGAGESTIARVLTPEAPAPAVPLIESPVATEPGMTHAAVTAPVTPASPASLTQQ